MDSHTALELFAKVFITGVVIFSAFMYIVPMLQMVCCCPRVAAFLKRLHTSVLIRLANVPESTAASAAFLAVALLIILICS